MLWLTNAQSESIVQHALRDTPHEACGILAGSRERVERIIPVANVAPDPQHHFRLDDQALANWLFTLPREGLSIVGFYHSHPNGHPIPSQTDIQQAAYPDLMWLIVGLKGGQPRLAAWHIHMGEVMPVDIHIGNQPPEMDNRQTLSPAQKVAIVLSMLIAFIFMLVLSLSLLPPAPIVVNGTPVR
jgi:proteasome lid subunit RPN8/RPN11